MSLATRVRRSSTTPAAPSCKKNVVLQQDGGSPTVQESGYVPNTTGSIATKVANYTAVQADAGKFLPCNGTFTVKLDTHNSPIVPNVDADWEIYIVNIGAGTVTVDGNGCTINGSTTLSLSAGQGALVRSNSGVSAFLAFEGAGSGGSSPNFADDEIVSGSGTSWTLAHTPTTGSLILQQYLAGFGPINLWKSEGSPLVGDYSISGANITTVNSISAGKLRAWYRY